MVQRFIDYNRGNDANDGSEGAPWQNLSMLAGLTWTAGDEVFFADDSDWSTADRVMITNCNGTAAAPIVFDRYNPLGGESSSHPIFRAFYELEGDDWTWDPVKEAWYVPEPLGLTTGFGILSGTGVMLLDTSQTHGTFIRNFDPAKLTPFTMDGQWSMDNVNYRYYLKSPQSENPTSYFGRVRLGRPLSGYSVFAFVNCGSHVHVKNLKFAECGVGILFGRYSYAGAVDTVSPKVLRCHSDSSGTLVRFSSDYVAGSFSNLITDPEASYCNLDRMAGSGAIHTINTLRPRATHNTGSHFTGASWPNGFVYFVNKNGHTRAEGAYVAENRFRMARHALEDPASDNTFDGCAIYIEYGVKNAIVENNIVWDTLQAMQDNSGYNNIWRNNITINCQRHLGVSDEGDVGNNTVTVYNSTAIMPGVNTPQVPTVRGTFLTGALYLSGTATVSFSVKNFAVVADAPQYVGVRVSTPSTLVTNKIAFQNVEQQLMTLSGVVQADTTNAIVGDLGFSGYQPALTSDLVGAGTHIRYGTDLYGNQRFNPPTIGAIEPPRARSAASAREARNG